MQNTGSICQLTSIFTYSMSQAEHMLGVLDPGELSVFSKHNIKVFSSGARQMVCVAAVSSLLIADIFGERLWEKQAFVHPKSGVYHGPLNLSLHK